MTFAGVVGWVRCAAHTVFVLGALALPGVSSAVSTGTPASLTLAWDASTDPTVTGYKVYYGVASRNYTNSSNAGGATLATISNLTAGVTYYFAATTYNSLGMESAYSAEAAFAIVPTNTPPTLNSIANLVLNENDPAQTVNLSGISPGTPASATSACRFPTWMGAHGSSGICWATLFTCVTGTTCSPADFTSTWLRGNNTPSI